MALFYLLVLCPFQVVEVVLSLLTLLQVVEVALFYLLVLCPFQVVGVVLSLLTLVQVVEVVHYLLFLGALVAVEAFSSFVLTQAVAVVLVIFYLLQEVVVDQAYFYFSANLTGVEVRVF